MVVAWKVVCDEGRHFGEVFAVKAHPLPTRPQFDSVD